MKRIIIVLFLVFVNFCCTGQNPADVDYFQKMSNSYPRLNDTIRIDMQGLTLYELITTVADENELNVSADFNLDSLVDSNFYNITIKDLFDFLVRRYALQVDQINDVLVFSKRAKVEKKDVYTPAPVDITYQKPNNLLSINLKNDSLSRVARALTDASGKNLILAPEVKNQLISSYILNRPFDQVVSMMASSNDLNLTIDENGFYLLEKGAVVNSNNSQLARSDRNINSTGRSRNLRRNGLSVEVLPSGFLNVESSDISATDLISVASEEVNANYFMYARPDDVITNLTASGITFDELLDYVFEGTPYTYKEENNLYLIGRHNRRGLRQTDLVQLENRTVESLSETLPQSLTKELEIKEFWDLNGFVVSGSPVQIKEFRRYINEIDQVVPVIQIEVLIVQYQKGYEINTGIQLGLDDQPRSTEGVLLPSTDMVLNSKSINDLIDSFNGLGWVNLGKVTQDFYASLKAMENNSVIDISSTPKLVTLNGHEASSSIGETNYYFEQNNRLINTGITDNILQSGVWKATDANLSVNIKPFVSKDEQITLKIRVEKNSFLGRAGENAPPGKATQSFESIVRVRNNEMVLLGGLDELERENSGTGAPLLSRIPILKWFFSNRVKKREKSKLHLFIRPRVIY